jgi:cytochrome d ubiquinol oxidase subunit I
MSFDVEGGRPDRLSAQDRPPVLIPFFAFRIMVGCGLVMLALAWIGSYLSHHGTHGPKPRCCSG